MAFVITETCIGTQDQACVSVCPVDCIHFDPGVDSMLFINPAECIDCGACQPACPVNAIYPDKSVPEAQARFTAINALWYQDKAAARAQAGGTPTATVAKKTAAAEAKAEEEPAGYIPPELRPRTDGFKWGENGVEGKCAVCGTYVIKGGVKFREKSVLCPEDAARLASISNPYGASAGRR